MKGTFIKQIVFLLLFGLAPGLYAEEGGWYKRDGTSAQNKQKLGSESAPESLRASSSIS